MAISGLRCCRCRMPPTKRCFAATSRTACAPIDIGGRSFRYPVFLGDDERNRVYDLFAELGPAAGLRVDIANDRRLDRPEWAAFLNDCRGTIGSEAGTWYLERDDRTALAIREFLRERSAGPDDPGRRWLHAAARRLPYGIKAGLKALQQRSSLRHEAFDVAGRRFRRSADAVFRQPAALSGLFKMHFVAPFRSGGDRYLPDPDTRALQRHLASRRAFYPTAGRSRGCAGGNLALLRSAERDRVVAAAHELVHDSHTYRHRLAALHDALSAQSSVHSN